MTTSKRRLRRHYAAALTLALPLLTSCGVFGHDTPAAARLVQVYDHVDLGDQGSESAHALQSSSSSGTSTEAGKTRRFTGMDPRTQRKTPNAYFEFEMRAVPGKPCTLRVVETFDLPRTRSYQVLVNGTTVLDERDTHTTDVGVETYEIPLPASLVTGPSIRVRFENVGSDGAFDPSIADLWSRANDA